MKELRRNFAGIVLSSVMAMACSPTGEIGDSGDSSIAAHTTGDASGDPTGDVGGNTNGGDDGGPTGDAGVDTHWGSDGDATGDSSGDPTGDAKGDPTGDMDGDAGWADKGDSSEPSGTLLLYDNCDEDSIGTRWRRQLSNGGTATHSTARSYSGAGSYKFTIPASPENRMSRAEILPNPNVVFSYGEDYWFGWAVYFPADWTAPSQWGGTANFHVVTHTADGETTWDRSESCDQCPNHPATSGGATPTLYYGDDNDSMKLFATGSAAFCMASCTPATCPDGEGCETDYNNWKKVPFPIVRGQWNTFVLHVRPVFLDNGEAITDLWVNGELYSISGPNSHNNPTGQYFKIGLYLASKHAHTIYIDELRAVLGGSYDDVVPR